MISNEMKLVSDMLLWQEDGAWWSVVAKFKNNEVSDDSKKNGPFKTKREAIQATIIKL